MSRTGERGPAWTLVRNGCPLFRGRLDFPRENRAARKLLVPRLMFAARSAAILTLAALLVWTRTGRAQMPPLAEISSQYVPESEVPDSNGVRAQISSYDASLNVPIPLGARTFLIPGAQYHADSVSYSNVSPGFVELSVLHSLDFPVVLAHMLSERWSLAFRVWPGIAGDFHEFDSSVFRLGGLAMANWRPSEHLMLGAGALASYGFGELLPLPLIYADWRPASSFRVEASLPFFATAIARVGDRLEVGLQADVNGNEYAIRQTEIRDRYPCAGNESDDPSTSADETRSDPDNCIDHLAYSVIAAGGTARVRIVSTLWLTTFFGRTAFRRYELKNPDGGGVSGGKVHLPNEFVFRAGLVFRIPMPGEPGS
jgi:hypothetical protein